MAGCFALSACMGSGDGATGAMTKAEANAAYADAAATANRINSGDLQLAQDPSGTATMTGAMAVDLPVDPGHVSRVAAGRLSMDVDFDNGSVTGKATNFGEYNNAGDKLDSVSGALDVAGSVANSQINANATGTLKDSESSGVVDTQLQGGVYDDNGTLLSEGSVSGTITADGKTSDLNGVYNVSQ